MAVIDWWNRPVALVVIFFALCLLLLTWSIAGIACRACHSSGTFFIVTHTPSWCNRKHGGRVSKRYRFESRRGEWALFSLIPSALSFVFLWHTHTHTHSWTFQDGRAHEQFWRTRMPGLHTRHGRLTWTSRTPPASDPRRIQCLLIHRKTSSTHPALQMILFLFAYTMEMNSMDVKPTRNKWIATSFAWM